MTVAVPPIDPARIGLSKSLMSSVCERRGLYSELVRDPLGRRLSFPMPEKVHFGAAVDSAHLELVYAHSKGEPLDLPLAVEKGMERAKRGQTSDDIDWSVFELQLRNAMTLFIDQPDGLQRIPLEGIRFQGANGQSLSVEDVIGTPDYLLGDGSVLDVKTAARIKSVKDFWTKAEMPVYAYLAASEMGVLPPQLIYQVYVRVTKPYWQWLPYPGIVGLVELGKAHANHWRQLIATQNVDLASFSTDYCGDCGFREAIPEVGHAGCSIGQSVPREKLDEAA